MTCLVAIEKKYQSFHVIYDTGCKPETSLKDVGIQSFEESGEGVGIILVSLFVHAQPTTRIIPTGLHQHALVIPTCCSDIIQHYSRRITTRTGPRPRRSKSCTSRIIWFPHRWSTLAGSSRSRGKCALFIFQRYKQLC